MKSVLRPYNENNNFIILAVVGVSRSQSDCKTLHDQNAKLIISIDLIMVWKSWFWGIYVEIENFGSNIIQFSVTALFDRRSVTIFFL